MRPVVLIGLLLGAIAPGSALGQRAPTQELPAQEAPAPAELSAVHIEARIGPDLRTVIGTIRVSGTTIDALDLPLTALPMPEEDLWLRRTFPTDAVAGRQRLVPHAAPPGEAAQVATFVTVMPDRAGAAGFVPGHGLFANGLWHPQPPGHPDGGLGVVAWDVRLTLPPGVTGVLGTTVGEGELVWSGEADRVPLAVLPDARVRRHLVGDRGEVVIVDQGRRRPRRDGRLLEVIAESWPAEEVLDLVVVETPAWRRLARPGPRVLFLSDRTFRVTGGLWRYHAAAVRRGSLEAALPIADPWLRSLAAEVEVRRQLDGEDAPTPIDVLRWLSWIPQIDSLLYDGTLPFHGEVFDEPWPADPVADDLGEVHAPSTPGRVAAIRLDRHFGEGTAAALIDPVRAGVPLAAARDAAGLAPADLAALRHPPVAQELSVDVVRSGEGWAVLAQRESPVDAPPEAVVVEIGDSPRAWHTGVGPDEIRWEIPDRPRTVEVDPEGQVRQLPPPEGVRSDRWPRPWTMTLSFFPAELSLADGRIEAYANAILRRRYDTRWLLDLGLATDAEDLARIDLGVMHYRGPLQHRRSRPVRLWAYASAAVLDPSYRPTDIASVAVGASLGAAWETRTDVDLPTRGHRLGAGVDAGVVPGSGATWRAARASAVGLVPFGGRVTLAGRLAGGVAAGDVPHRLLSLGGSSGVRGVNVTSAVGQAGATGNLELRWQALRMISVPLPLAWLSDVQLTGGLDGGLLTDATLAPGLDGSGASPLLSAVGWAAGLGTSWDILGARPTYMGVTVAGGLLSDPIELDPSPWPEFYLRFNRAF